MGEPAIHLINWWILLPLVAYSILGFIIYKVATDKYPRKKK